MKLSKIMEAALLDMLRIGSPVALMPCKSVTTKALMNRGLVTLTADGKMRLTAIGASVAEELAEAILVARLAELDAQPVEVPLEQNTNWVRGVVTVDDNGFPHLETSPLPDSGDSDATFTEDDRGNWAPVHPATVGKLCKHKPSMAGHRAKWRKGGRR